MEPDPAPEWQCPNCKAAYNKVNKQEHSTQKASDRQAAIKAADEKLMKNGLITGIASAFALFIVMRLFEINTDQVDQEAQAETPPPQSAEASTSTEKKLSTKTLQTKENTLEEKENYLARLRGKISYIGTTKVEHLTSSKDSIGRAIRLFSSWAEAYEEREKHKLTVDDFTILNEFQSKITRTQNAYFPQLRKAYGPIMNNTLWSKDIRVRTYGKGFRKIEYTGAIFAANSNIEQFMNIASDQLHHLRFKEVQFQWRKGADQTIGYTLHSANDSELRIWVTASTYRTIDEER